MGVKQPACAPSGAYSASQTVGFVQRQASAFYVVVPSGGVTLSPNVSCLGVAGFSQVTIAYTFQTAVPLLLGSLAERIAIQAVACFPNQA